MAGDLGQRIGKREPFETKEEEALLNLVRTADRVQARVARLLKEHGLTPAQYNVLRILRGLGRPTPILEVAERMLTETPGITGLIDRLEKLELVRRQRCEHDRRVIFVVLGPKGADMLAALEGPTAELRSALLSGLDEGDLSTLIRLLDRVREPLEGP
ncbi:MarR family transcriptional regulator [Paludisphaera sp.]|uniref:MarR family winged helix-turn-helix transcriptional regulator n=1 Tax=Paludisphaera sp. TaxID=2017432 RepID=UPI00301BA08D